MDSTDQIIATVEQAIDTALDGLSIFQSNPEATLRNCYGTLALCEEQIASGSLEHYQLAQRIRLGLTIVLPRLLSGDPDSDEVDAEQVIDDLMFASHYYLLRDYIYYGYNSPDSLAWHQDGATIRIKFADPEMPRQFAQAANTEWQNIVQLPTLDAEAMEELLLGQEELGGSAHIIAAFEQILPVAQAKIALDFDLLGNPATSNLNFTGYSYAQFVHVYEYLTAKAMFHRIFAAVNSTWATFAYPQADLIREICYYSDLPEAAVRQVLGDIAYSRSNDRLDPAYFGAVLSPYSDEYFIEPTTFLRRNGLVQLLRLQALHDPNKFLAEVSGPLGNNFVNRVADSWRLAGFFVATNVRLDHLDPRAPDIDVLAVAREPTLGYVAFVCELKATVPASWAKDHLRVLRKDSLPKAFTQLERILSTLSTEAGTTFLRDTIYRMDPEPLEDVIIPVRALAITTQNSGMLVSANATHAVVDHATLRNILTRCDGDVLYVLRLLADLPELFAPGDNIVAQDVELTDISIRYEAVSQGRVIDFSQNEWRSTGLDQEHVRGFFAAGHTRGQIHLHKDD